MALHDDIFVSPKIKYDIRSIFDTQVPTWKKCLVMKITKEALDKPVFRQPGKADAGYLTSPTVPLSASTWRGHLVNLGKKAGLQLALTQYCFRRGLVNAVNRKLARSDLVYLY